MIKTYVTRNSKFVVDTVAKTVRREHKGNNPLWNDGQDIPYSRKEHTYGGGILFEVVDPSTGKPRPFETSEIKEIL